MAVAKARAEIQSKVQVSSFVSSSINLIRHFKQLLCSLCAAVHVRAYLPLSLLSALPSMRRSGESDRASR